MLWKFTVTPVRNGFVVETTDRVKFVCRTAEEITQRLEEWIKDLKTTPKSDS